MARIPYPDPAQLPEVDREFLQNLPQLNISRLLAGSPSMFRPLTRVFSAYLNDGVLDTELREIIILRVGHQRNSTYEVENHQRAARVVGMSDKRIAALEPGQNLEVFSESERQIIQYVDELVVDGAVTDATFNAVEQELDSAALIELTVVIGVYTMVSQICSAFELELEDVPIADTGMDDIGRAVGRLES